MNMPVKYGFALLLLLSISLRADNVLAAAEAGFIAKVGNVAVTEQDLQREIEKRIPMQVSFHGGMKQEKLDKIRAEAKEALVVRSYKVQYALDNEIAVDPKAFDAEWSAALAKTPQLGQIPAAQQEYLKKELYLDLLAKVAEDRAVAGKVSVTDADIKAYYDKNRSQFLRAKLFKASHIFVKVDPGETAESKELKRQKAEKLLERAKSGEDFYNLAYYESDDRSRYVGGSLGSFHANQMVPEFSNVMQKMKPGDVAGPIKTLYGYHIVKLDDVQPEKQMSFEESADNIRTRLTEERRTGLYEAWMDSLRKKYPLQTP